jgi:hypothetical protein
VTAYFLDLLAVFSGFARNSTGAACAKVTTVTDTGRIA